MSARSFVTCLTVCACATVVACNGVTDSLLEADDPDLILPENTHSLAGALAVANGALGRLNGATGGVRWLIVGLLADEWASSSSDVGTTEIDQRAIKTSNGAAFLRPLYQVRTAANQAIGLLRDFAPTRTSLIGEMFFTRGFAELELAADYCNGIPLSDGAADPAVFGEPLSVLEVFDAAVSSFDSALAVTTGTDAQSLLVVRASRVGKGRALLGMGDFVAAAATVANVPTSFAYQRTFSLTTGSNGIWDLGFNQGRFTVADSVEGNNRDIVVPNVLPFASAKDARLPVVDTKLSTPAFGQDGATILRTTTLYDRLTPIDIVNGIDARLIEAESALKAGNVASWLATLNGLRTGPGRVTAVGTVTLGATALVPLLDPGTLEGRVHLTFRERAFWTFGRGQRLGDLRRLVRQYGRASAKVFPVGPYYKGGLYGSDVNLPVVDEETHNPKFRGCLDRNA